MQIRKRLHYWWAAFGLVGRVTGIAYTLYGVVLTFARPETQGQLNVWSFLPRLSASEWLAGLFLVLLVGFMEGAYRDHRKNQGVIETYEAVWPETYALTCDLERKAIALINMPTASTEDFITFQAAATKFWNRIEVELFGDARIQPHEVTKLQRAHDAERDGWKGNPAFTKYCLNAIQAELHALTQHYRPTVTPIPASARRSVGRGQ